MSAERQATAEGLQRRARAERCTDAALCTPRILWALPPSQGSDGSGGKKTKRRVARIRLSHERVRTRRLVDPQRRAFRTEQSANKNVLDTHSEEEPESRAITYTSAAHTDGSVRVIYASSDSRPAIIRNSHGSSSSRQAGRQVQAAAWPRHVCSHIFQRGATQKTAEPRAPSAS